ncbi:MAG TPA: uroporphyrinogen decarboxylase family protein [Anaerolineales bacterium]|nr:uroporphyrinogen decarboxylase family protein [Anaerolineales bacterium]
MNTRERFNATMHYQPRDRAPIADFGFWEETIPIWHGQGLPEDVFFTYDRSNTVDFFGMDFGIDSVGIGVESGLCPAFEERVLEDYGNRIILQQSDGVIVERDRFMSSIPKPLSHTLTDRDSWRKHFVPRLNPATPERFPSDWEERVNCWKDPQRDRILALPGGSLYGWLRNWMGLEKLSLTVYDDPTLFDEVITTVADCIVAVLEKVFASGVRFDACGMWEDMAYNAGPLLSPKHFRRYMMPHLRRITDVCHRHGVDVIWVDCDGKIDLLLPLWLEAGVNCMFPIEVGTWHADPIKFRKQYGKNLLMMGGFDKHVLAQSTEAIEREILRLTPLVEEGGYIAFCDHRVPPDVPYQNYLFYLEKVREIWGRGINLEPFMNLAAEY